jgi:hypothetical protein
MENRSGQVMENKAGLDRPRQDKAGQDTAGEVRAGQGRAGRSSRCKAEQGRTGGAGQDKTS